MRQCSEIRQRLERMADGSDPIPGQSMPQALSAHLDTCSECAEFWQTEKAAVRRIRLHLGQSPDLPEGFHARFMARLKDETRHSAARRPVLSVRMAWAMAAVCVLCAVGAAFLVRVDASPRTARTAPPTAKLTVPAQLLDPVEAVPISIPDLRQSIPGAELGERMMRNLSSAVRAVTPSKATDPLPDQGQS